jgi:hypothetical protein
MKNLRIQNHKQIPQKTAKKHYSKPCLPVLQSLEQNGLAKHTTKTSAKREENRDYRCGKTVL